MHVLELAPKQILLKLLLLFILQMKEGERGGP